MTFEFTVPGPPVGKAAPRIVTIGGHPRGYIPKPSKEYMARVSACFLAAHAGAKPIPKGTPVRLELWAYYEPPKSWSKKRRAANMAHKYRKVTKPDLTNILKGVEDALSGLAFDDDNQVADQYTTKRYAEKSHLRVRVISL